MVNLKILGFADPVSSWSHLATAFASVIGAYYLLKRGRGNRWRMASLAVYSFSLIFLFSMSGVYHLLDHETVARSVLQRLDHAGIWTLIAGTLTPIHAILFRGISRWGILLFVWIVSITGLVFEVIYFKDFPEWLALSFFLVMGWIGAFSHLKFRRVFPGQSPTLIVWGGACYSMGAILDFIRWPVFIPAILGPHEIFHFFVTAGALCHWRFIYQWSFHPISDTFICDITSHSDEKHILVAFNDRLVITSSTLSELREGALKEIKKRYFQKSKFLVQFRYSKEEHIHVSANEDLKKV